MAFRIKGKIYGQEATIVWDGHSYATTGLMERLRTYYAANEGHFIGFMPDDGAIENYDRCAPAAYAAWMDIFEEVIERSGEFPWEAHEEGEVR